MTSRSMRRANERKQMKKARSSAAAAAAGLLAIGTGAPLGAMVVYAGPAQAADLTVSNTQDSGPGSLRDAIEQANASPGADVVTFDALVTGTIELTSGQMDITDDLEIDGPGSQTLTIDAGGLSRVFDVTASQVCTPDGGVDYYGYPTYECTTDAPVEAVVISGLTLSNGQAPERTFYYYGSSYTVEEDGGAIRVDAANFDGYYDTDRSALVIDDVQVLDSHGGGGGGVYVRNAESVTVTDSTFTGNAASRGSGGALQVRSTQGPVTVAGSTFDDNEAAYSGGAVYTRSTRGDVTVDDTTVTDSSAGGSGGGLALTGTYQGNIEIRDAVVSGNSASGGNGGGLMLYGLYLYSGNGDVPTLTVTDTEISGNTAYGNGGGVTLGGFYSSSIRHSSTFTNTTIADNTADGMERSYGGGVFIPRVRGTEFSQTFTSTTIAGNNASRGGGIVGGDGEKILNNSIVADNLPKDLTLSSTYADPFDLDFTLVESPARESTREVTAGSAVLEMDPQLGALGDNGGDVQTMMPAVTSPAVDAGKSFGLTNDARGGPRTVDLGVVANAPGSDGTDIGNVEVAASAVAPVVNNAAPAVSGDPRVGSSLSTTGGTWTPSDVTLGYQWLRDGAPIDGAMSSTYDVAPGDVGSVLAVQVTASRSGYETVTKTSSDTAAVEKGVLSAPRPSISGKAKVKQKLTAVTGDSEPAGAAVFYQWLRNGTPINKATKAVGLIKRSVQTSAELPFELALTLERELQAQLFASSDAKEGLNAYVEKRKPEFQGK